MSQLQLERKKQANLLETKAKYLEKASDCHKLASEIEAKIASMEAGHRLLEERYLTGGASIDNVTASQAELALERAKLAEIARLAGVAEAAIKQVDRDLLGCRVHIIGARSEFCISKRDESLAKIQADSKLKALLLEAMAPNACNGLSQYTTDPRAFAAQFLRQIVPDIAFAV